MNTFEIAALGLQHDGARLRTIGHNVANIATPGYKRQVAVAQPFANAMEAAAAVVQTSTDLSAGKLQATDRPLDVALDGRQFLVVQTASGELALRRGGSLSLDAQGRLVDAAGLAVQGASGALTAPPQAAAVRLDAGAQLWADDKPVGRLRIVQLEPGSAPAPLGDGLHELPAATQYTEVQAPSVRPGQLEASNAQGSVEMVALLATMRHAESMAKLLQGSDEMVEKAIRKLGEMS